MRVDAGHHEEHIGGWMGQPEGKHVWQQNALWGCNNMQYSYLWHSRRADMASSGTQYQAHDINKVLLTTM